LQFGSEKKGCQTTKSNEALANGLFEEFEEIEQTLMHRCVELLDQAELIEGLTNYHWWPQTA